MTYLSIANSSLLYILVSIAIITVLSMATIFLKKSWSRAIEIGISKDTIKKIIKSSIYFTIVPSIAIVIGLFALSPVLGIPWSWLRLSVVGSVTYELMAADMATKSMGLSLVEAASGSADTFGNIMFVMTAGISAGMIVLLIFGKKILNGVNKMSSGKTEFGRISIGCFMIALLAVFIPEILTSGKIFALTFITSVIITLFQGFLIKKFNINWLKDFVFAFSLVLGMTSSILWTSFFI